MDNSQRKKQKPNLLKLFSGLERRVDFERWPEQIFFFHGETCLFRYDLNDGWLWCKEVEVWEKIKTIKGLDYLGTQSYIKNLVEQHFKCKVVTPGRTKR